jgi:hypothetical protein
VGLETTTETQQLLLIAAAEPLGDWVLVWRAAEHFHIGMEAAAPAVEEGLCESSATLRFRHPLVCAALYHAASTEERRAVHRALALATSRDFAGDRATWHRAQATTGCDEQLAVELERLAARAQERGGLAQAAALLQRASAITPELLRRARRALGAARAECLAGEFETAGALLAAAEAGPLDELGRAHAELLRAKIAFAVIVVVTPHHSF